MNQRQFKLHGIRVVDHLLTEPAKHTCQSHY